MKHKLITVFDLVIIAVVVLVCVGFMLLNLLNDAGKTAVITVNNEIVEELSLDEDQTRQIKTEDGYNNVVIKNNECFIVNADCRDGICVKHKAINKVGQTIVCLPHKLIVEIK